MPSSHISSVSVRTGYLCSSGITREEASIFSSTSSIHDALPCATTTFMPGKRCMTVKPISTEATNMWLSSQPDRIGAIGWPSCGKAVKNEVLARPAPPPENGRRRRPASGV